MHNLMKKEFYLASSRLSWLFLAFAVITLCPGYPILCSAFFITFGIFQSFQYAREANDIVYSLLLPVSRRDIVRARYRFAVLIELLGFAAICVFTLLRMTVFSAARIYRDNALMNANPFFLGVVLVIFGLFNAIFIGGFYHTAYKFTKPFVFYLIAVFPMICLAEALHHLPGLDALNAFGFEHLPLQLFLLLGGGLAFFLLTVLSCQSTAAHFEKLDL